MRLIGPTIPLAGLLLAASLAPMAADARSRAAAPAAYGVTVDVSRLRALGLGPTADLVQGAVAGALGGSLPGGRIVVRITGLSLNSYAGSGSAGGGGASGGGAGGGGGGDYDYLEGDILVIGSRGEVLSQRHQVSSSPASSGGAYYLPGAERRRVEAVSRVFADWARRLG